MSDHSMLPCKQYNNKENHRASETSLVAIKTSVYLRYS